VEVPIRNRHHPEATHRQSSSRASRSSRHQMLESMVSSRLPSGEATDVANAILDARIVSCSPASRRWQIPEEAVTMLPRSRLHRSPPAADALNDLWATIHQVQPRPRGGHRRRRGTRARDGPVRRRIRADRTAHARMISASIRRCGSWRSAVTAPSAGLAFSYGVHPVELTQNRTPGVAGRAPGSRAADRRQFRDAGGRPSARHPTPTTALNSCASASERANS